MITAHPYRAHDCKSDGKHRQTSQYRRLLNAHPLYQIGKLSLLHVVKQLVILAFTLVSVLLRLTYLFLLLRDVLFDL